MKGARHEEDSGGDDVEVVELYAGHHRHHQEADQLQEGEEGVECAEEPELVPRGVDAVVHGAQEELWTSVKCHHQGPHVPLGRVTADGRGD